MEWFFQRTKGNVCWDGTSAILYQQKEKRLEKNGITFRYPWVKLTGSSRAENRKYLKFWMEVDLWGCDKES